jgi:hypothetical protein
MLGNSVSGNLASPTESHRVVVWYFHFRSDFCTLCPTKFIIKLGKFGLKALYYLWKIYEKRAANSK